MHVRLVRVFQSRRHKERKLHEMRQARLAGSSYRRWYPRCSALRMVLLLLLGGYVSFMLTSLRRTSKILDNPKKTPALQEQIKNGEAQPPQLVPFRGQIAIDVDRPKPDDESTFDDDTDDEWEMPDRISLNNQRSKSDVRKYLNFMRVDKEERRIEEHEQPDYNEPTMLQELKALAEIANELRRNNIGVRESLRLFVRPGHRRRVTDLIGGRPMTVQKSREMIAQLTSRFLPAEGRSENSRDFKSQPIRVPYPNLGAECDVPCAPCAKGSCDSIGDHFTMENERREYKNDDPFQLVLTPWLTSNVPVPYFSWHDFGIMTPDIPVREMTGGLAAAFISNCGYEKRNAIVTKLRARFGEDRVHSFGSCMKNKDEPQERQGDPAGNKIRLLQRYKFSLAFENSETQDYITEKFFGSLVSGSIPAYMGAPNVKFFAPDTGPYPYESDAVLRVSDFGDDADRLGDVFERLDESPELFEEMRNWKEVGYTDDFKTLIDMTDVHSGCRACIYIADRLRYRDGINAFDIANVNSDPSKGPKVFTLFARERGTYKFYEIGFRSRPTIVQVVTRVLERISRRRISLWVNNDDKRPLKDINRVYALYTIIGRRPVLVDEDVAILPDKAEIEVIFT